MFNENNEIQFILHEASAQLRSSNIYGRAVLIFSISLKWK